MGRNAGRDEWELPDFGADADADVTGSGPAGTGGPAGRSARHARGVVPAVALIALLAAGIAIGGIPEPASTDDSESTAAECEFSPTDAVPRFDLRAPGSEVGYPGLIGFTHRPGAEAPGSGWETPAADAGRGLRILPSGSQIEVHAAGLACIRYLIAEYADATLGHVPSQAERRPLAAGAVEPPRPNPVLGPLPDGDWVVRVSAYFESGVSGPDGLLIAESYFRVQMGPGPFPTPTSEPTPLVTPAVSCGPSPAAADEVEIVMTVSGSEPVPGGVAPGTAAPVVEIPLGEQASLAVTGDACALRWTIDVFDAATGERYHRDLLRNSHDDPGWISQNRWQILPVIGSYDVIAELHFGQGVDVVRTWRVIGAAFTVPDTFLVADDGTRVKAVPGCGVAFNLANGYSGTDANDLCGPSWGWGWGGPTGVTRTDLPLLRVRAWSRVTLEIPGWTVMTWNGACGQIEPDEAGNEVFSAPECWLGGYNVEGTASPPAPAQFLARPGDFVAQLGVTASGTAGRYDARMYARIVGR